MRYCSFVATSVLVVSLSVTAQVAAQESTPRLEVGVTYAWESLSRRGPDVTAAGFQSIEGRGGYIGLFLSPRLLVTASPGVTFGDGSSSFEFGSELRYLFNGATRAGPYASLGFAASWGGPDVKPAGEGAVGVGLGYRLPVTHSLTAQVGFLHQRWLSDQVSQTGLSLGLGIALGSKR